MVLSLALSLYNFGILNAAQSYVICVIVCATCSEVNGKSVENTICAYVAYIQKRIPPDAAESVE